MAGREKREIEGKETLFDGFGGEINVATKVKYHEINVQNLKNATIKVEILALLASYARNNSFNNNTYT